MAERQETSIGTSGTSTVTETSSPNQDPQSVVLKLRKPKNQKKVKWDAETVDNEFMGKKSSKCCCVYVKPRAFGESSESESDEENEGHNAYCPGHNKKHKHKHTHKEKDDES